MANRVVQTIYDLRDQVRGKLSQISASFRQNADIAEKSGKRIDAAYSGNGLVAFSRRLSRLRFSLLGIGAVVGGVVAGLGRLAQASSIQADAEERLAVNTRNASNASQDQIEALKQQAAALQDVTKFGDEQIISAQALLATFNLNTDAIAELTPRLLDASVGMQKTTGAAVPLESIATAIGKAFTDGIGALTRYGVSLSKTQKDAFATADAQEKLRIVTEALDANYEGLAEKLGQNFSSRVARAGNAFGDLAEDIGDLITESEGVNKFLDFLTQSFKDFAVSVSTDGGVANRVLAGLTGTIGAFGGTVRSAFNILSIVVGYATKAIANLLIAGAKLNRFFEETFGDGVKQSTLNLEEFGRALNDSADEAIAQDYRDLGDAIGGVEESLNTAIGGFKRDREEKEKNKASTEALTEAQKEIAEETKRQAVNQDKLNKAADAFGTSIETLTGKLSQETQKQLKALDDLAGLYSEGEVTQRGFYEAMAGGTKNVEDSVPAINALQSKLVSLQKAYPNLQIQEFISRLDKSRDALQQTNPALEENQSIAKSLGTTWEELTGKIDKAVLSQIDSFEKAIQKGEVLTSQLDIAFGGLLENISGNDQAIRVLRAGLVALEGSIPVDLYDKWNLLLSQNTEQYRSNKSAIEESIAAGKEIVANQKARAQAAKEAGQAEEETAEKTREAVGGISEEIASTLESFRSISEGVAEEVDAIVKKITLEGGAVNRYFADLGVELTKLNDRMAEQETRAAQVIATYDKMPEDYDKFGQLARGALSGLEFISESTRRTLERLVDRGTSQLERFKEDSLALADEIQREFEELTLTQDELFQRDRELRRQNLIERRDQAKSLAQFEVVTEINAAIEALDKIEKIQDEKRAAKLEKDKQAVAEVLNAVSPGDQPDTNLSIDPDVTNNTVNIERLITLDSSPTDARRIAEVIERLLRDYGENFQ